MSNDLEDRLRDALRPIDPREGFAQRVMSRIESKPSGSRQSLQTRIYWLTGTLAASLVLCILLVHAIQTQRERKGLEARRQLIEALRLTGEQLDFAYQAVNGEPPTSAENGTGA